MTRRWLGGTLLTAVLALGPVAEAAGAGPRVVQDRLFRHGDYTVVDAVVENTSTQPVEWTEVSVEFYDFFDDLLSVEHAAVRPPLLAPGDRASIRVTTPYTDELRKVRYRFTWRQDGVQRQNRPELESPRWR